MKETRDFCIKYCNRKHYGEEDLYGEEVHLDWVSLLAYLGAKYGGDFTRYKEKDMDEIAQMLLTGEKTEELLAGEIKYYDYYREADGAVLGGMVGEYEREYPVSTEESEGSEAAMEWKKVYGLKAYHPIAKGFPYSDYDDFGVARTYGYRRNHLGHDLMGQAGDVIGYLGRTGYSTKENVNNIDEYHLHFGL